MNNSNLWVNLGSFLSFLVNDLWLTPYTIVLASSLAGALIITCLAPAFIWAWHASLEVNAPVHSKTTSTLNFPQGNLDGSSSAKTLIFLPLIINPSSS